MKGHSYVKDGGIQDWSRFEKRSSLSSNFNKLAILSLMSVSFTIPQVILCRNGGSEIMNDRVRNDS